MNDNKKTSRLFLSRLPIKVVLSISFIFLSGFLFLDLIKSNQPATTSSTNPPYTSTPISITTNTPILPTQILPSPVTIPSESPTNTSTPTITPYPQITNPDGTSFPITWGEYPPPATFPSVPIPPPLLKIPKAVGQVNILLLGNDHTPNKSTHIDTIILLSLNPNHGTASAITFPRDLYVYAPGWTMMKINTVVPRGGYDLLFDTFEYNFGVRPDFYVNISRDAFKDVIDKLGGIDLYVPVALDDPVYANGKFSVEVGWTHMDGATARWYVSSRATSDDFSRNERQLIVLEAIFKKLLSKNGINRASEIYWIYKNQVWTNLTLNDLLPLIPLATKLADTSRITRFTINNRHVTATTSPTTGAFILLPDQDKILEKMILVLSP